MVKFFYVFDLNIVTLYGLMKSIQAVTIIASITNHVAPTSHDLLDSFFRTSANPIIFIYVSKSIGS